LASTLRRQHASSWHHIGIWEAPSTAVIDKAMRGHEEAADFKFTTSRHFVGLRRPLKAFIEVDADTT
jgi:hypothetical protein